MQHTIEQLLIKINGMKEKAEYAQTLIDNGEDKDHIRHALEQVQSMALQISKDTSNQ